MGILNYQDDWGRRGRDAGEAGNSCPSFHGTQRSAFVSRAYFYTAHMLLDTPLLPKRRQRPLQGCGRVIGPVVDLLDQCQTGRHDCVHLSQGGGGARWVKPRFLHGRFQASHRPPFPLCHFCCWIIDSSCLIIYKTTAVCRPLLPANIDVRTYAVYKYHHHQDYPWHVLMDFFLKINRII